MRPISPGHSESHFPSSTLQLTTLRSQPLHRARRLLGFLWLAQVASVLAQLIQLYWTSSTGFLFSEGLKGFLSYGLVRGGTFLVAFLFIWQIANAAEAWRALQENSIIWILSLCQALLLAPSFAPPLVVYHLVPVYFKYAPSTRSSPASLLTRC
jgi:hypothetical protein